MAQVSIREIRGKTADELKTRLGDLKKEAYNLRFRGAMGDLENLAQIRLVRREIARIKTVMNENVQSPGAKPAAAKAKPAGAKPAGAKPKTAATTKGKVK